MSGSIRMFPAGDAVLLREHGIEHTPTNPLESWLGRARLGLVESFSCTAVPPGLVGDVGCEDRREAG